MKKWSFSEVIKFILTAESGSLRDELLKYFDYQLNTPSNSSFNQRRAQILPEAFEFLFQEFNLSYEMTLLFHGLRIVACDGSDFNISYNPEDTATYFPHGIDHKGYNQLHLNAMYDLCSRRYIDAVIQPGTRLILYNFCEIITTSIVVPQISSRKHAYQLDYTRAIKICLYFLRIKKEKAPPNVENLIRQELLPVRVGRTDPRKVKPQSVISFLYRVA